MYNLKSEFDIGAPGSVSHTTKSNIYGFGLGHKVYEKVYLPQRLVSNDPDVPGPGKYDLRIYNIGKHSRKSSLHGRPHNVAGK